MTGNAVQLRNEKGPNSYKLPYEAALMCFHHLECSIQMQYSQNNALTPTIFQQCDRNTSFNSTLS